MPKLVLAFDQWMRYIDFRNRLIDSFFLILFNDQKKLSK